MFDPSQIPWVTAFWASDRNWTPPADGAAASSWRDFAGNGHTASQATGSKQPVYRQSVTALNNKPAVEFDGVDDFMQTAAFTAISQPGTIYIVDQYPTFSGAATQINADGIASGNRWITGYNSGGGKFTMFGGGTAASVGTFDANAHAAHGSYAASTGTDQLYIDGTAQGTPFPVDVGSATITGVTLGSRFDGTASFANTRVAFYGLLDRALTERERRALDSWAQDYYGITVSDYQGAGRLVRPRRFRRV